MKRNPGRSEICTASAGVAKRSVQISRRLLRHSEQPAKRRSSQTGCNPFAERNTRHLAGLLRPKSDLGPAVLSTFRETTPTFIGITNPEACLAVEVGLPDSAR